VYLLDTNIISLLDCRCQALVPGLVPWLRRNGAHLFLSVITLTELEAGSLNLLWKGKGERAAEFERLRGAIQTDFGDRILCLDASVAVSMAHLAEKARPHGIELTDLIVAATAKAHGLILVTRNTRTFDPIGVTGVDPTLGLPPDVAP
jgi:hypothetical protein